MAKAAKRIPTSLAVLAIVAFSSTCSTNRRADVLSMQRRLTTANGLAQNGLTTNGLWNNGLWNNGLWNNGLWNNGLWNNGLWNNGLWNNGLWNNGLWNNGLWNNGLWNNGLWNNGLTGDAAVPGNTLRNSAYARQLLQYIYSCAMPATTYDTTLDPNEAAPLVCASDPDCDVGYSCVANKCVIPLQGAGANNSGLAINDDLTTWWGVPAPDGATDLTTGKWGKCDESCQRWVSACVLARTNAYGVHVQISMRVPSNAPVPIQHALAVDNTTGGERATYTLREGAYYGNIFATTPVNPPPPPTIGPNGVLVPYSGPEAGPISNTPQYFACAGPNSNIPQITKRFCSSQGDQAVINVPGVCITNSSQTGVCAGEDLSGDTAGAIHDCSTGNIAPFTQYSQVITVFLHQPIAVCGNAVCEEGEDVTCLSDCHPGTWSKNYAPTFETLQTQIPPLDDPFPNFTQYSMAALAPDDSVVVVGDTTAPVDLEGVTLPMGGSSGGAGILVKYNADGSYAWSSRGVRFNNTITSTDLVGATGITVAPSGNIMIVGSTGPTLWLATFTSAGTQLPTRTWTPGGTIATGRALSVDSAGNIYIVASLNGTGTFATSPATTLNGGFGQNVLLLKVSPTGSLLAAQLIPGMLYVGSVANDSNGNTILTAFQASNVSGPTLVKKCADPALATCADGSTAWDKNFGGLGQFTVAAADASGNVYAGGYFGSGTDFGGGSRPMTGFPPNLVKYDANGNYQWDKQATVVCAPSGCNFASYVYPANISFDTDGNVVLASWGTPSIGGGIDFGLETFPTYATSNIFLAAYQPTAPGTVQWSKQIPGVLGIDIRGIAIDSLGRVVVSGTFGGSMVIDDVLLVTGLTEDPLTVNPFIASFGGPPPGDNQAPLIGSTVDSTGVSIDTVPQNIYAQATSPAGAEVFYMPPTAIDDGDAGTNVICFPPPNTTFSLGTTTVTCTASDPRGFHASASFTVTVVDKIGPIFSPVADIAVPAVNFGGATVPYTPPTATDQISGPAAVTCTPTSGSQFAVGSHTVTCTASDASGNQSSMTFAVNVTQTFGAPCLSTTDCAAGTCLDGVCCNTMGTSCGQCQACNTAGALGTCAPTSGGSCNDNNACTQADTCQAGVCTGANPVTCSPSDQCHVAGSCDPGTGACSNPAAPNGTTCNDGNACTQIDSCQAGVCAGANPVTCSPSDQCHVAGSCNPATGACANPAAADGTACNDGNACTAGDVCTAGACGGGAAVSCDDQNPCTVDSCNGLTGCAHTPGNAGAVCRAAANACDSTEACTGTSASCPSAVDTMPPALAPATNQTIVGNCSGSQVVFAVPALLNSSCEGGTNITCTWSLAGSKGTCAKSGNGASVPGNRYGAFAISCTAKDAAGNVSSPVAFTVTVLQPLTIRIQPPLSGDNKAVDNVVKLGSTVPNKARLYGCGSDVTRTASVIVKLGTTYMSSGGSTTTQTLAVCTNAPDTGGVMILDGANYRYNLATKGLSVTASAPAFYQENVTAAYKSAPTVVVGSDAVRIDIK